MARGRLLRMIVMAKSSRRCHGRVLGQMCQTLILTTNLEFSRWGTVFGDDNMAAAVIDRIVHHGRLLQFRGESYRVKNALMK